MTLSAAAPLILVSLLFFSSLAVAGIFAPGCSANWIWSFNSLGQNACTILAYMMSTCYAGSFTVPSLPPGYQYTGPDATQGGNLCMCSTIVYSLMSACTGCQGSEWITWSKYSSNCTTILPPSTFPNPIPAGTSLPLWALLDVTSENTWNVNISMAVGERPELGPGMVLTPSGVSASALTTFAFSSTPALSPSSSTSSNSRGSATPMPMNKSGYNLNTGAIAVGVTIAVIFVIIAALLFYRRRRRPPAPPSPLASDGQPSGLNPHMDQVPGAMSASMLRYYNPDDPATYPTYQGSSSHRMYHLIQPPSSSSSRILYTVVTAPKSQGQGLRYSGLPIV